MSGEPFDITPSNDGGVLKLITKEGTSDERPPLGSSVTVHYTGTLLDGTKFDSSRDKNTPFSFSLGQGQVIKGWDIGVASMRRGEMCVLTIASEYAYGASGSPPKIPPGATLKFEVELLSWAAEDISPDRDGSISREKIVPGEHLANPNDTSNVDVHIVGTHEGRVFLDKELSFVLGEGCVHDLPEGVDRALRRFEKGEKSKISLRGARFTYGANPPAAFNLPPNAPIQFTIFLKDYEKVPHTWEMTAEQKLEASKAAKERGTFFLQSGNIRLAVDKYKRVEEILEYEKTISDEAQKKERNALLLAAYLNLALAETKRNELNAAVKYCDKALEMDAKNVKALYRRATAKITASDYEDAKATLKTILDIEPDNKAAQQQILVCQQKMKEVAEKEKKCFRGMFSKLGSGEGDKKEQKNPFEEAGPSGEEPTAA